MITVSAAFTAAEIADVAAVATKVYLFRGNYATASFGATTTSSGDDSSGDYPSSGVCDGDRTEINIGAPDDADNGIGLSSWKSSTTPNAGSPVYVEIDFNATRTLNYVKLYNLAADPLTSYRLQYWDGAAWQTFAGTPDKSVTPGYTGGLDVYDLEATASDVGAAGSTITTTKIRAQVYTTTLAAPAQIVEIEVYYKVDVTTRATAITVDRQRDWKQVTPMSATATIVFDNSDSFFSPSYTPTAAQVTDGFFNSELDVDLGVQVKFGFWYATPPYFDVGWGGGGWGGIPWGGGTGLSVAAPELVNSFVGSIDELRVRSLAGTATVTARDGMKRTFNQTWSTRLKNNIDVGAAVQYMLNICNVSDYEMAVDSTSILIQNFFAYESSAFSVIQQLVQAAGNAQFWYDENGIATFDNLLASTSGLNSDFIFTAQNLNDYTTDFTARVTLSGGAITQNLFGASFSDVTYPIMSSYGWRFTLDAVGYAGSAAYFLFAAASKTSGLLYPTGYAIKVRKDINACYFVKITGGHFNNPGGTPVETVLGTYAFAANDSFEIFRADNGAGSFNFYVYQNGAHVSTVTDNTFTTFLYSIPLVHDDGFPSVDPSITLSNFYYLNPALSASAAAGVLTLTRSGIDQGASITAEGTLGVGIAPAIAPITFQTRTAPDNVTWTAWTTVTIDTTTSEGPITSATNRWIEYRLSFAVGAGIPIWGLYYVLNTWSTTVSVSSVRQLSYDSTLCDVTEVISDSLGGDSSVINYFEVLSSPALLSGSSSDVQWTASTGSPLANVSATNPLIVYTGTIYIQAVVASGMDTSFMDGTNPSSIAITWGTATGSVAISYVHPTKPIIAITVTGQGTITNLQLKGQALSGSQNPISVTASGTTSQAKYGRRTSQISNNYIASPAIAQLIANTKLALYQNPATIVDGIELPLTPSLQLTDQIQLTDTNTGLSTAQTWNTSGITQTVETSGGDQATIKTALKGVLLTS